MGIKKVQELHHGFRDKANQVMYCRECTRLSPINIRWPCATLKALTGKDVPEEGH